jgi:hypothetical protein
VTVGRSHNAVYWAEVMAALRATGSEGTLSIVHKNFALDPQQAITEAATVLAEAGPLPGAMVTI